MNILLTGFPLCLQDQTSMSSLIATNFWATLAGKNYNYTTGVSDWRYEVFFLNDVVVQMYKEWKWKLL